MSTTASLQAIAAAMQRVEAAFRKRPHAALGADEPALACWEGGLRTRTRHASGADVVTEMPPEIGGAGGQPTPGWLMRSALASCAVTRIAMAAAAEGITLATLEAQALSRSDHRGLLAMTDADGNVVSAGPGDVQLHVRIAAAGVPAERLQALVHTACRSAPVSCAMEERVAVAMHVQVEAVEAEGA